jgi:hypothetical protein
MIIVGGDCLYVDHLGTKFFQILLRHLSSSPLICPSLLASQPGSFRPKIENNWLAVVVLIEVRVRLESSSVLRSLRMALAAAWSAILPMLAVLCGGRRTGRP